MSLVDFLNGTGPDYQGRYLRDIWDFDDKAIEQTHDFIPGMFPLTEKSMSVPGVPTLSAGIYNSVYYVSTQSFWRSSDVYSYEER